DAAGLLLSAIEDPDPGGMMEPIRLYRAARGGLPNELEPIRLGTSRVRRIGNDVTPVAWGAMVPSALAAANEGATGSIPVDVIDRRGLSRVDGDAFTGRAGKPGRRVVAQGAPRGGGPGAELVAHLAERCFYALRSPPGGVAGADVVYPPQLLEDEYLPDAS